MGDILLGENKATGSASRAKLDVRYVAFSEHQSKSHMAASRSKSTDDPFPSVKKRPSTGRLSLLRGMQPTAKFYQQRGEEPKVSVTTPGGDGSREANIYEPPAPLHTALSRTTSRSYGATIATQPNGRRSGEGDQGQNYRPPGDEEQEEEDDYHVAPDSNKVWHLVNREADGEAPSTTRMMDITSTGHHYQTPNKGLAVRNMAYYMRYKVKYKRKYFSNSRMSFV